MKSAENKIRALINEAKIEPGSGADQRILADALSEFEKLKQKRLARSQQNVWRIIMRSRITKLAAAACIIIAVVAGIYFITGKTPAVTCCVWAQIADKVEQIKTCIFRMQVHQTDGPGGTVDVNGISYISSEYGNRTDTYVNDVLMMQMYTLPKEMMTISVLPLSKRFMRVQITDEYLATMKQKGQDPRDMVKAFMLGEYKKLGPGTINGIAVEGIEVVNPPPFRGIYESFVGKLWVDVATELPVRLEIEGQSMVGDQMMHQSMVMDDFVWEAELEPAVFEPNIPADYTVMAEAKLPGQDEASAIEGLRIFAELTDGNYPGQMNVMSMTKQAGEVFGKKYAAAPNAKPDDEQMKQMTEKMLKAQASFMFYNKLVQDGNDPKYYGKDVKAGDANSVLMSWKVSDDAYRVIYGDLTAEDVNAQQLKEMEQPTNQ